MLDLPLETIRPPWILLRPVMKTSLEYLQLRDAIHNGGKNDGLLNSISVRTSVRWPGFYEIVDGMYRFTIYQELGIPCIPAIVVEKTDEEVLAAQIQANAIRKETTKIQYAQQILRLKNCIPNLTMPALASMIGKSPSWVKDQLSLLELPQFIQAKIDRGEMLLCNGYMLAKIPSFMRAEFVEDAQSMKAAEFEVKAALAIRSVMEHSRNKNLQKNFVEFKAQPHLRTLKQVLNEIKNRKRGVKLYLESQFTSTLDAWVKALEWACNLDPESHEKQRIAAEKKTE